MPLLLPVLKDHYSLQRAMLILFPGLYVVSAALFSVCLFLLIAGDICKKRRENLVKSKSPGQVKEASRQRRRRRVQARLSEASPLLQEVGGDKNGSVQGRDYDTSSNSDSDDFIEIDEREQNEAQRALESAAAASSAGGAQRRPIIIHPSRGRQGQGVGRGRAYGAVGVGRAMERGRGYGALDTSESVESEQRREPAPVVGSVSEWSVLSPSLEETHWLAEMQEGI